MNPSIRKGDRVKVITPHRFIRCGYALTPDMLIDELVNNHSEEILTLVKSLGIETTQFRKTNILPFNDKIDPDRNGMSKLLHALAYLMVASRGFGGKDRMIFSEYFEHLDQAVCKVTATRQVMTGKYYGPSGGYTTGYDGGDYWDQPGGLEDRKSNKILRVDITNNDFIISHPDPYNNDQSWEGLWIQAEYCEKLMEE